MLLQIYFYLKLHKNANIASFEKLVQLCFLLWKQILVITVRQLIWGHQLHYKETNDHIPFFIFWKIKRLWAIFIPLNSRTFNYYPAFFHNSHLNRWIQPSKMSKKIDRLGLELNPNCSLSLSVTLTITLECFLCLCEAITESYLCLGNFVQFV